jgi:leader peptidase (prepilin peptidase)/N-methyltransferase
MFLIIGLSVAFMSSCMHLLASLTGGLVGLLLLLGIAWAGRRLFGREAMGGGDIKAAAVLGVFLGWQKLLLALFVACLVALLWVGLMCSRRCSATTKELPFGPFFGLAAVVRSGEQG